MHGDCRLVMELKGIGVTGAYEVPEWKQQALGGWRRHKVSVALPQHGHTACRVLIGLGACAPSLGVDVGLLGSWLRPCDRSFSAKVLYAWAA